MSRYSMHHAYDLTLFIYASPVLFPLGEHRINDRYRYSISRGWDRIPLCPISPRYDLFVSSMESMSKHTKGNPHHRELRMVHIPSQS